MYELNPSQQLATAAPGLSFVEGPAGSGKTTALHRRLQRLIREGVNPYSILVLVAQPEHGSNFKEALRQAQAETHSELTALTHIGLARQMVSLFWPLIARDAGFGRPSNPPTFLSYDLAQLLMSRVVAPYIDDGAFISLSIRRQQIISQILDTLNRAALNGLSLDQGLERQKAGWLGSKSGRVALDDAFEAAREFRERCLERNMLDLSLLAEVFEAQVIRHETFRRYFRERYRHLLVDNLEEQTPSGQFLISSILAFMESACLAYDVGGGYKRFLAADPEGAYKLQQKCSTVIEFKTRYTSTVGLEHLANLVENKLLFKSLPTEEARSAVLGSINFRFRRQMIGGVVEKIQELLSGGTAPDEIVLIAPYLDAGLRFGLAKQLENDEVPYRFLRRRGLPRDEPRIRAWLTWLKLANPDWNITPKAYDVAEALALSIKSLDPVRAHLVTRHLYQPATISLLPISACPETAAERIGDQNLELVEELRLWLGRQSTLQLPADVFLYRLFHELLGRQRFSSEPDYHGAAACDWLVKVSYRVRQTSKALKLETLGEIGRAIIDGVDQGLVSSNPPEFGRGFDEKGVSIATVYGFLLHGRPFRIQIWLDAAATGWWDIPRQPLSNAFVLNPSWPADRSWTLDDDIAIRNELLSRLIRGLTDRCLEGIILANSELDRRGFRQDGPLLRALTSLGIGG